MNSSTMVLVIPAYRPSPELVDILRTLLDLDTERFVKKILVIDDGSEEEYWPIFDDLRNFPNVVLLRHAINLGKGAALKTGFNYALVHYPKLKTIITADADGQHAPKDILHVVQTSFQNPEALVIGSRNFTRSVPLRSLIGNVLTRYVIRLVAGINIPDTQSGLRGWPKSLCKKSLKIAVNGFDFETECLLSSRRNQSNGLNILQVPIETIYDPEKRSSHFSPILDSMRIYFVFFRYMGTAIFASILDCLLFLLLYKTTENIAQSLFTGRALAIFVAYQMTKKIVFHDKRAWFRTLPLYLLIVSCYALISYILISYLHNTYFISVLYAKILTESVLFFASFSLQRIVFEDA